MGKVVHSFYSGQDGSLVYELAPATDQGGSAFGWFVNVAGDLNQDGVTDIAVGAPYTTVGGQSVQGRGYIYSGADGQLLLTLEHPEPAEGSTFGWRIINAGDLNKDGPLTYWWGLHTMTLTVSWPGHCLCPQWERWCCYLYPQRSIPT